jgi:hypothetical protein
MSANDHFVGRWVATSLSATWHLASLSDEAGREGEAHASLPGPAQTPDGGSSSGAGFLR